MALNITYIQSMKKRKLLATGGIITTLFFAGVGHVSAQTVEDSLQFDKEAKKSLISQGFSASQIHKIYRSSTSGHSKKHRINRDEE